MRKSNFAALVCGIVALGFAGIGAVALENFDLQRGLPSLGVFGPIAINVSHHECRPHSIVSHGQEGLILPLELKALFRPMQQFDLTTFLSVFHYQRSILTWRRTRGLPFPHSIQKACVQIPQNLPLSTRPLYF